MRKSPLRHGRRRVISRLTVIISGVIVSGIGSSCLPRQPEVNPLFAVRWNLDLVSAVTGAVFVGARREMQPRPPLLPERVVLVPPLRGHAGFLVWGAHHVQGALLGVASITDD